MAEVGELGLLEMLRPHLARGAAGAPAGLELGAGDDAALWRPAPGRSVAVTTDSLVEDVHFHRPTDTAGWSDLGWKLLAVSLSDLAAMAATPGPAFISLSLPGAWQAAWVVTLYEGVAEIAGAYGACVGGGNITAAPSAVLTSTLLGDVEWGAALTRAGASPGWRLAVTGEVGGAAAALRDDTPVDDGPGGERDRAGWRMRQARPLPRLKEARHAAQQGIGVAIDVSDGLFADAGRLLATVPAGASGLVLDAAALPVAPGVREAWPADWLEVAGGGEDYELLLAGPADTLAAAVDAINIDGGVARVIGEFDDGDGVRVSAAGVERPAPAAGHRHFG